MKKKSGRKFDREHWFAIVSVGETVDTVDKCYDAVNCLAIVANIAVGILMTFTGLQTKYGGQFKVIEAVTVAFFAVDFALRVWTADYLYPKKTRARATLKYIFSFSGIVDLLSFLPYYLPVAFPAGIVVFRLLRVVRIFKLFRINAYYDSISVIVEVISSKRQQLISSVFIILVLMLASSLCMYSLEHEAQPDKFVNAFSGIWWAVSTLLTVGYGDIYPITTMGQICNIIITFLGVGMVAIPTGIISAGFVDQYSHIKRLSEYANESEVHFIKINISERDSWSGKTISELRLPHGIIVAAIQREQDTIVPRGDVKLLAGDMLVLGAQSLGDERIINLKELVLKKQNPWNGMRIRDLDISRQTVIVLIERNGRTMIPNGDLVLHEGDKIILYSRVRIANAQEFTV